MGKFKNTNCWWIIANRKLKPEEKIGHVEEGINCWNTNFILPNSNFAMPL